jgi:hypothetical protein
MTKNQFFYERRESVSGKEGEFITKKDSFNLDKIILTMEISPTERLVVLDDFHEEIREVPSAIKNGKVLKIKKEKGLYQTNVTLMDDDNERFIKLMSIE